MQAYSCWQGGTPCFETSKWAESNIIIYGSLSQAVGEKDGAPQHRLREPGRERQRGGGGHRGQDGGAAHQHPVLAQGAKGYNTQVGERGLKLSGQ